MIANGVDLYARSSTILGSIRNSFEAIIEAIPPRATSFRYSNKNYTYDRVLNNPSESIRNSFILYDKMKFLFVISLYSFFYKIISLSLVNKRRGSPIEGISIEKENSCIHVFTLFSRIIPRWKITEGTKNDRIAENGLLRKNEREEEPSNGLTRRGKRERERRDIEQR